MVDLWPADLKVTLSKPPVTILKEQAALLGSKTRSLVEAEVVLALPTSVTVTYSADFEYGFYIAATALGGYRYKLFTVRYGVDLYPVQVFLGGDLTREVTGAPPAEGYCTLSANSEGELIDFLRRIFNAPKTRRIIGAILAQVGAEGGR